MTPFAINYMIYYQYYKIQLQQIFGYMQIQGSSCNIKSLNVETANNDKYYQTSNTQNQINSQMVKQLQPIQNQLAKQLKPLKTNKIQLTQTQLQMIQQYNSFFDDIEVPDKDQCIAKLRQNNIHYRQYFQQHQQKIFQGKQNVNQPIHIQNIKTISNFQIVSLVFRIGPFSIPITILNVKNKIHKQYNLSHLKMPLHQLFDKIGQGSFSSIYGYQIQQILCQFIRKNNRSKVIKKIAIKCNHIQKLKQSNNQQFAQLYQKCLYFSIKQYCFFKICSILQIGPKIINTVGFDIILYDQCAQFDMQYCLQAQDILKQEQFSYKQDLKSHVEISKKIQKDLKRSLKILHSLNIVHRDIKTANYLFSPYFGKFVLADFGTTIFNKQPYGFKSKTHFAGTYSFSSPQMKKIFNKRTGYVDLYYNDMYAMNLTTSSTNHQNKAIIKRNLHKTPIYLFMFQIKYQLYKGYLVQLDLKQKKILQLFYEKQLHEFITNLPSNNRIASFVQNFIGKDQLNNVLKLEIKEKQQIKDYGEIFKQRFNKIRNIFNRSASIIDNFLIKNSLKNQFKILLFQQWQNKQKQDDILNKSDLIDNLKREIQMKSFLYLQLMCEDNNIVDIQEKCEISIKFQHQIQTIIDYMRKIDQNYRVSFIKTNVYFMEIIYTFMNDTLFQRIFVSHQKILQQKKIFTGYFSQTYKQQIKIFFISLGIAYQIVNQMHCENQLKLVCMKKIFQIYVLLLPYTHCQQIIILLKIISMESQSLSFKAVENYIELTCILILRLPIFCFLTQINQKALNIFVENNKKYIERLARSYQYQLQVKKRSNRSLQLSIGSLLFIQTILSEILVQMKQNCRNQPNLQKMRNIFLQFKCKYKFEQFSRQNELLLFLHHSNNLVMSKQVGYQQNRKTLIGDSGQIIDRIALSDRQLLRVTLISYYQLRCYFKAGGTFLKEQSLFLLKQIQNIQFLPNRMFNIQLQIDKLLIEYPKQTICEKILLYIEYVKILSEKNNCIQTAFNFLSGTKYLIQRVVLSTRTIIQMAISQQQKRLIFAFMHQEFFQRLVPFYKASKSIPIHKQIIKDLTDYSIFRNCYLITQQPNLTVKLIQKMGAFIQFLFKHLEGQNVQGKFQHEIQCIFTNSFSFEYQKNLVWALFSFFATFVLQQLRVKQNMRNFRINRQFFEYNCDLCPKNVGNMLDQFRKLQGINIQIEKIDIYNESDFGKHHILAMFSYLTLLQMSNLHSNKQKLLQKYSSQELKDTIKRLVTKTGKFICFNYQNCRFGLGEFLMMFKPHFYMYQVVLIRNNQFDILEKVWDSCIRYVQQDPNQIFEYINQWVSNIYNQLQNKIAKRQNFTVSFVSKIHKKNSEASNQVELQNKSCYQNQINQILNRIGVTKVQLQKKSGKNKYLTIMHLFILFIIQLFQEKNNNKVNKIQIFRIIALKIDGFQQKIKFKSYFLYICMVIKHLNIKSQKHQIFLLKKLGLAVEWKALGKIRPFRLSSSIKAINILIVRLKDKGTVRKKLKNQIKIDTTNFYQKKVAIRSLTEKLIRRLK